MLFYTDLAVKDKSKNIHGTKCIVALAGKKIKIKMI